MIELRGIGFRYDDRPVLAGVDLSILGIKDKF